jgi:NTP pyrophosphatase (non-canonical NTP hydrolase)
MGKLQEELAELSVVASRCIIQGINEVDPGTGKINRDRLHDEIADVVAQCVVTINLLELDFPYIDKRVVRKVELMKEWEDMFLEDEDVR